MKISPILRGKSNETSKIVNKEKKLKGHVNKAVRNTPYEKNEILKRLIYFKANSNINRFAESVEVSRQCIFGVIAGTIRPSPQLAKRISEKLNEDTRVIFPDGSINYPEIKTAYEIEKEFDAQIKNLLGENNNGN